jgi:hypothetical protein
LAMILDTRVGAKLRRIAFVVEDIIAEGAMP